MSRKLWMTLVLTLGLAVPVAPVLAEGRDNGAEKKADRGEWHGRDHGRDQVRAHDRDHDSDDHRPGWSKGRKTGWKNCDLPPGQAKKHGCRDPFRHGHYRRHVYRGEDRARPVIGTPHVHAGVQASAGVEVH